MATAAPEAWPRLLLPLLAWLGAGAWVHAHFAPGGQGGLWLALFWMTLWGLRWLALRGLLPALLGDLACPCRAPRPGPADLAMGWMMGTVWLHADLCLALGLPLWATVLLHAALMALVPLGLQRLPRVRAWAVSVPLLLVLAGALLVWAGTSVAAMAASTWLVAWAWALPRAPMAPLRGASVLTLCMGPPVLWALHVYWPQHAAPLLGGALCGLGLLGWRLPRAGRVQRSLVL